MVFTVFEHTKLHPFQNLSLGFILKIFLKFRKFQPRYSYKIYSYRKKRVYNNFEISLVVFMPNITTNHAITYTGNKDVQFALLAK